MPTDYMPCCEHILLQEAGKELGNQDYFLLLVWLAILDLVGQPGPGTLEEGKHHLPSLVSTALGGMAALCCATQLKAVFENMENDLEQALAAVELVVGLRWWCMLYTHYLGGCCRKASLARPCLQNPREGGRERGWVEGRKKGDLHTWF